MDRKRLVVGLVALVVVVALMRVVFSGPSDGMETDTDYAMAYAFKAELVCGEDEAVTAEPGVAIVFGDRQQIKREMLLVPAKNGQGIALIREDRTLPQNTIRKSLVRVPEQRNEGTVFPAYEYVEFRYHMGTKEPQYFTPRIRRRDC